MRVGLLARADNTGLGHQTWEFFKHIPCAKVMLIDIGMYNGNESYPERYSGVPVQYVKGIPTAQHIAEFLKDLDVVFTAETPYNYELYSMARAMGVKTVAQYNYEFFDWFTYPAKPKPDMLIAPSMWHYNDIEAWAKENGVRHQYLHCPVNTKEMHRMVRSYARTFLHIAGKPAAHDRNGTFSMIEAARKLKSHAKVLILFQGRQGLSHQLTSTTEDYQRAIEEAQRYGANIEWRVNDYPLYTDLYREGDVLILPRRYGGNCLQLNEALAAGMPVIMPDVSPNHFFLPEHWLVPAAKIDEFTPRTVIDIHAVDTDDLAAKIDSMYAMDSIEMMDESRTALHIADQISWPKMGPRYVQAFEELCNA